MILVQRSPLSFGPNPTLTPVLVTDVAGTSSTVTNSGVSFERQTGASFHYDYQLSGLGVDGASVSYSSSPIDDSAFPILKREAPGSPVVRISNGRGETSNISLDFRSFTGSTSYSPPKSLVAGSYAKYSWDRVAAIFSALDDGTPENHRVLDENHQRRLPSIIPHSSLTCHTDNISVVGGQLRPIAITRRHCLQISHSGPGGATGGTVRFRDINGTAVDRVIVANINVGYGYGVEIPAGFSGPKDIRLLVLDSDLPESITPAPYVGDWFLNYTGTATSGTIAPGAFGFAAFNQDTHISPIQAAAPTATSFSADYSLTLDDTLIEGREFGLTSGADPISLEGFESWSWFKSGAVLGQWYPDRPFHHFVRAGDSGSPVFWPVADGKWAIGYSMISGSMWRPVAINALIAEVNDSLGIGGTYTVTVAPDPTA